MVIGERLRKLRKSKNLSQGDIETRTGMLRAYISRVENGHTIPTIESLGWPKLLRFRCTSFFMTEKCPRRFALGNVRVARSGAVRAATLVISRSFVSCFRN
jgi:Helix-turn-helix